MDNRLLTEEEITITICGDCPFEDRFTDGDCHACQRNMEAIALAQRDLTREECQERVDKLIAGFTEYIETRKSDLADCPSISPTHSLSLRVRRETLDFALKFFLDLANK